MSYPGPGHPTPAGGDHPGLSQRPWIFLECLEDFLRRAAEDGKSRRHSVSSGGRRVFRCQPANDTTDWRLAGRDRVIDYLTRYEEWRPPPKSKDENVIAQPPVFACHSKVNVTSPPPVSWKGMDAGVAGRRPPLSANGTVTDAVSPT